MSSKSWAAGAPLLAHRRGWVRGPDPIACAEDVRMQIAVLGGGNGSLAAAGDLALEGHEVRLWRRDRAAIEAHRVTGGIIVLEDFRGRHEPRLALVTSDIAEAVLGASLILCPTPATAQADIAKTLAPHLTDGQVVFLPPGTFGSVVFAQAAHHAQKSCRCCVRRDGHSALARPQARAL